MGITLQRTRLGCHLPRSLLWIYSRCLILHRMLRQWMGRALLALRRGYSNLGYRMDRRLASDGSLSVIYLSASFSSFPIPIFRATSHFIPFRGVRCRFRFASINIYSPHVYLILSSSHDAPSVFLPCHLLLSLSPSRVLCIPRYHVYILLFSYRSQP